MKAKPYRRVGAGPPSKEEPPKVPITTPNSTVEVPTWAALLWFLGPFGFAAAVVVFSSQHVSTDITLIIALMFLQALMIYLSPPLKSFAGVANVLASFTSLWVFLRYFTFGPIRSMLTMEICMNGILRYAHLLSSSRLRSRSFSHRLAFVTVFHDVDTTSTWGDPTDAQVRRGTRETVAQLIASVAIAFATWVCLRVMPSVSSAPVYTLMTKPSALYDLIVNVPQILCGTVFIYSALTVIDCMYRVSLLLVRPRAIICVPAMNAPYLAASFAEFWGRRWDRPMQGILLHSVFLPLRNCLGCSKGFSVFLTFFTSGVVHTLGIASSGWVSWQSCGMMLSFFLLHAVFALVEALLYGRNFRASKKTKGAHDGVTKGNNYGCGWLPTQLISLASAPLFVLPFLELLQTNARM